MNKTVVVLVGLATLVSPAIPSLAQSQDDASDRAQGASDTTCTQAFDGDHWTLATDAELPGLVDVSLAASNASLATQIQLPGEEPTCHLDDDRVRMETTEAEIDVRDRSQLRLELETDEEATARIALAAGVTVEDAAGDEDQLLLALEDGPTLALAGENLTRQDDLLLVEGEADLSRHTTEEDRDEDADEEPGPPSRRTGPSEERGPSDARGGPDRATGVSEASYEIGSAQLALANDTLEEVRWRNATLFDTVEVPGLTPAEERRQGPQLRLDGEDARLRLTAAGGLRLSMEADAGLEATIASDVEVRQADEDVFLSTDDVLVVVEGDDLALADGTLEAEELRLHARSPQQHDGPVWRGDEARTQVLTLPYAFEGRHVAFQLHDDGIGNLSIHGTPVGEVAFDPVEVEELDRRGVTLDAEGEGFELRVQDTPAVQLRLEADNVSVDLDEGTTLPSGAEVHTRVEDDEVRLRVDRPADALANETSVEHRPASEPVERTEGPAPGLQTRTESGQFGVQSDSPSTITTSFDAEDELGNVSVHLGLARAMLIDDTNGNDRVDVGEPALAERPLTNGTASVEDEQLVHRLPLWSGQLTVTVEPGDETAKVTYTAENLSAPPGTLFVLETNVQAPADANLTPTDTGVVVDNGSMQAEYSATGPVTVDGEEAWAQRSIFVDGDDRVRVLVAYPAGDDIEHDPTVSVQSSAQEVVQRLAASPWSIAIGVGLAGVLVAGTVLHRRNRRP